MLQCDMPKKGKKKPSANEAPTIEAGIAAGQVFTLKVLVLENGFCPIEDWIKGIRDTQTRQRIQIRLDRIERGNLGDYRSVGEGVSEFRLDFGAGYRIYYAQTATTLIVLLGGGDKSTQDKDIALAQRLWRDYKNDTQRYERDVRR
jgi:putative addiction module killer protein